MTTKDQRTPLLRRLSLAVAAMALFATACGGAPGSGATSEEQKAAATAAEASQAALTTSGDLSQTELIDTRTGAVTDLSDVVTGDRAVLLWYWAPH